MPSATTPRPGAAAREAGYRFYHAVIGGHAEYAWYYSRPDGSECERPFATLREACEGADDEHAHVYTRAAAVAHALVDDGWLGEPDAHPFALGKPYDVTGGWAAFGFGFGIVALGAAAAAAHTFLPL